jgi:Ca2+-binding RTX toxin-like protein
LNAEVSDPTYGGKKQAFDNGTIVWRSSLGGFILTGKVLERWNADGGFTSSLKYPISDTSAVVDRKVKIGSFSIADPSALVSRFEGGTIYYSAFTGGAQKLSSAFASAYETQYGGPNGWLGMPVSDELHTLGGAPYVNFENGILIRDLTTGKYSVYGNLDLYVDRFDTWGDDCVGSVCGSQDPYWYITITNSAGEEIFDKRWGNGNSSSWTDNNHYSLGKPKPDDVLTVKFHAVDIDDSSPNDNLGTDYWTYSMSDTWGKYTDNPTHKTSLALGVWSIASTVPYDDTVFRNSEWWNFGNFQTAHLSKDQYAQTFRDVNMGEWAVRHPFNALYYALAYKGIAAGGNCYGMSLESVLAQQGKSVYREPIYDYFPDTQKTGIPLTYAEHINDAGHQGMVNELGIKQGYQLGRNQVLYSAAAFLSGATHEPTINFTLGKAYEAAGEDSLVLLSGYFLGDGHAVRAMKYELTSEECSWMDLDTNCDRIYIADPNKPYVESVIHEDGRIEVINEKTEEPYIQIAAAYNAFHYSGPKDFDWTGESLYGSRLHVVPTGILTTPQVTPFADALQLLEDGVIVITGSSGVMHQITDDSGRTMFQPGLSSPPTMWSQLQEDESKRIPHLAPVSVAMDTPAPFQLYAGTGVTNTSHTYDIGLAAGVTSGTAYDAMITTGKLSSHFTIPGTAGKPEHVRAVNIGSSDRAMEVELSADTNAKSIEWGISGAEKTRWTKFSDLAMNPGQRLRMTTKRGGYQVVVENFGNKTSAKVTVNGGRTTMPVDVGKVEIPSGTSVIDFQLPKTTASVSNQTYGKAGWLVAPVTISFDAVEYTGTGLKYIEYSTNGVTWTKYTGPFNYSSQGVTTVYYRARDNEGNQEVTKSLPLMIDTNLPTATGTVSTTSGVQLTYSVTDPTPGSGAAGIHALVQGSGGSSSEVYYPANSATVNLPTTCSAVEFWGEDVAGNNQSAHVVIADSVAPKFTAVPDTRTTHCTSAAGRDLSVTVTDDCGVVSLTNNAPAKLPLGTTLVTWTAKDAKGNTTTAVQTVIADLGDDPSCCPSGSNIIIGTSMDDVLNGTTGNDCIIGLGSQDKIYGNGGNDALSGGDGDDQVWAGAGNDWVFGGTGQDRLYGEADVDQIVCGDGADTAYGGAGDDTLWGGQGGDNLYGDAGNDKLYGELDDDYLYGGTGTNYMDGGLNHDWYTASGTADQCVQDGGDDVNSGTCSLISK